MSEPWTPGPWNNDARLRGADGWQLWAMEDYGAGSKEHLDREEADARLIALAPEMAEQLDSFVSLANWCLESGDELQPAVIIEGAHSLLARARGESIGKEG